MTLEDIQLPNEPSKVVQLYIDKRPILRVGNKSLKHKTILENTLNEFNIPFDTFEQGDNVLLELTGERYRVVGMGTYVRIRDIVRLNGHSFDYGIKVNKAHTEEMQKLIPNIEFICLD